MRVAPRTRKVSLLNKDNIHEVNNGFTKQNIELLNKYYNEYAQPCAAGNFNDLHKNMQPEKLAHMIKQFSPFLRKHGPLQTINSITLSTLTCLERGMWYKMENDSLAKYIQGMESNEFLSVSSNINTRIVINLNFAREYLLYIQTYGVPEDGLFDPILLQSFL
jgi:hypothetical protein